MGIGEQETLVTCSIISLTVQLAKAGFAHFVTWEPPFQVTCFNRVTLKRQYMILKVPSQTP